MKLPPVILFLEYPSKGKVSKKPQVVGICLHHWTYFNLEEGRVCWIQTSNLPFQVGKVLMLAKIYLKDKHRWCTTILSDSLLIFIPIQKIFVLIVRKRSQLYSSSKLIARKNLRDVLATKVIHGRQSPQIAWVNKILVS